MVVNCSTLETLDASGCIYKLKHDISTCKHTIIHDPSLCYHDLSYNSSINRYIHTFDLSHCVHTLVCDLSNVTVASVYDVSANEYTYTIDISNNLDISCSDISYNKAIIVYDICGCIHTVVNDLINRDHTIVYDPSLCTFTTYDVSTCVVVSCDISNCDASGNKCLTYDISDSKHTIVYDPSLCIFTSTYDDCTNNYTHTLKVFNSTILTKEDPEHCKHTHEFDISDCIATEFHVDYLTCEDVSYCTHLHVFDPTKPHTLVYDISEHAILQWHDTSECTSTYRYDTSCCHHTLVYYHLTCTWKHTYDLSNCAHEHVYDIIHCKPKYVFDTSECKYALFYDKDNCTHNDTHRYLYKHVHNNPYVHYFPHIHYHDYYHAHHGHHGHHAHHDHIYGYKYMHGVMSYVHKCASVHHHTSTHDHCDTHNTTGVYNRNLVHDPCHSHVHGYNDTTHASVLVNHTHNHVPTHTHDQFNYYSKLFNPVYDAHLQHKGLDYYSDSIWSDFTKVKYGLFDSDNICVINQCEFVVYVGNDYVRFSEYDITTDIFYSRLTSINCKLYKIMNVDFKEYQSTKEFLCDNIFNCKKLMHFKKIYTEYLSLIELLILDIENIQGLASNNENIGCAVNTTNEGMMRNTCARFSKLYCDIEKNVLMSQSGDCFDMFYIDYANNLTLFGKNHNLTVTQFIVDEKIIKLVLTLDRAHVVLEYFTDTYTHEMLRTLCQNNLLNTRLFQVIMELNLKNIDDLLMKQYNK